MDDGSSYGEGDRARWVAEPPKRAGAEAGARERDDFARDRARVLHSYAFRRLADKTQVVVPGEDDFPRTRLTHSLEVAQIAREIAAGLGCDPDVADAAGLAHDIGHPPFGHNGEQALDEVARSCGGFEGNAQTLRVLTRLEPKVLHPSGAPAGLNLTRAALDAACKYPWPRREGSAKFGYYAADRAAFAWLRDVAPPGRRCLEAQVMDWADDVAYSVHDVEDGVHAGLVRLGDLDDTTASTLCAIAAEQYSDEPVDRLAGVLESLLALPTLRDLADYDGSYVAQAAAKRATSELTGRLAGAAVTATRARYGADPLTRYAADLVVPADAAAECALLKAVAVHYVMRRPGTAELQASQRELLTELVAALCDGAPGTLDPALATAWHEAASDDDRLRVVVDQVAQLTDSSAVAWHARLVRPR
ncbi:deoxyguanosinetriphosphate triphosphohydrolase [Jatrophihabitans endophyticus]|uniref:deoxyguanosinetriphosphate triphosphohydrolase n=1 Tax=Jatrophihabitans endophyticus TaxID=1206085 RepID=UPI001A03D444|nr:deoxyguanosinetriphosphate triphosphohydrolase [Jatrophihabitans endophyticus]MBE7188128.1 deoxyguanosinetriphosphate triphosphohydrolase [Jatrophihabitans endophyticus]